MSGSIWKSPFRNYLSKEIILIDRFGNTVQISVLLQFLLLALKDSEIVLDWPFD